MKKLAKKYAKFDTRPGFVPEQDEHFTVNYLPVIEGWTTHAVKEPPALDKDQWVEVIHRNGEHARGPVDTFAWRLYRCHGNVREDYGNWCAWGRDPKFHEDKYDYLDLEITHYRTIQTPPDWWLQGMEWPSTDEHKREAAE